MSVPAAALAGLVLELLAVAVALFAVAWVAIFGGIGALFAQAREGSARRGFLHGVLFGPVGWFLIWLQTREDAELDEIEPGQDGWGAL